MFVASPYIAAFYGDDTLTPIIRVLSLTIIISGVKGIQQAMSPVICCLRDFSFLQLGGQSFQLF